jgi:biopolymer transport protein ExbD
MKIHRARAVGKTENILPMINVVFLLLIFFMLAGALQTADLYEIHPLTSRSETAVEQMEAVVLMDQQGRLALDGVEIDEDGLRRTLSAHLARRPELVLRLKVDGRVSTPRVVDVMEMMRDAGLERLVLLTLEPET